MERGGFEPPKASPADLQSAPFGRSGTSPRGTLLWYRHSNDPAIWSNAPQPTSERNTELDYKHETDIKSNKKAG